MPLGFYSCLAKPSSCSRKLFWGTARLQPRRHGRSTPAALLRPGEALAALGAWAAVGALWCAAGAQHCASSVSSANAKRWLGTEECASDTPQHWQRARKCDLTVSCLFRLAAWEIGTET